MAENDNTQELVSDLNDRQLLEMILARLSELEVRFAGRDTNPLPRNYAERFERVERQIEALGREVRGIREDLEAERQRRFTVEDRLGALESRIH